MGSHYGVKIRKRENDVLKQQRQSYVCPTCQKKNVARTGYAHWKCGSCGTELAGGAYALSSSVGISARKTLQSLKPKK
ncbi:50S ribosomal protein L37ae [Candidatus Micrarchaeota archaeon]|nr:50S ribosomal protein L37ae [Candidatus Micrarchaeota archaeon]